MKNHYLNCITQLPIIISWEYTNTADKEHIGIWQYQSIKYFSILSKIFKIHLSCIGLSDLPPVFCFCLFVIQEIYFKKSVTSTANSANFQSLARWLFYTQFMFISISLEDKFWPGTKHLMASHGKASSSLNKSSIQHYSTLSTAQRFSSLMQESLPESPVTEETAQ